MFSDSFKQSVVLIECHSFCRSDIHERLCSAGKVWTVGIDLSQIRLA